jgi:hypothetical protein
MKQKRQARRSRLNKVNSFLCSFYLSFAAYEIPQLKAHFVVLLNPVVQLYIKILISIIPLFEAPTGGWEAQE